MGFDPPHILAGDLKLSAPETPWQNTEADSHGQPGSLEELKARMGDCRKCRLHECRTRLVFGEGSPNARLVFVGEGPGKEEDRQGRPFVGPAGKLLTKIIENGIGIAREDVYICNIVKCRPPKNRDPEKDEITHCIPFLKQQIRIINPDVICALGRVAGQAMLGGDFRISRQRGTWFTYMGIPLMPTYHPAYLLRYDSAKRQVWDDVKKIMKHLGIEV
jgi:DNA polymerase